MRGNVTVDPVARATAVAVPEIRDVRGLKSGHILDAKRFIESIRYDRLVQIRSQIKEAMEGGRPRVACAICGTPVYLVASPEKAFFFRHRIEDGSCPAQTRNGLTEDDVRAMKYKGAQESEAHRRLKGLIERSLRADPRFESVKVETTWHAQRDRAMLRRPDVQAITAELRIAFEAQLTTTFLDVVIGRKNFYRSEGGLLVWILPYFDPTYRQLTVDDLLFNNNANVFVIDRETTEASETENRFIMRCTFRRPVLVGDSIGSIWENKLVAWGDLTIDLVGQRAFIFDCEKEERALIAAQKAKVRAKQDARDQILRDALFAILNSRSEGPNWEERFAAWSDLKGRFAQRGLHLAGEFEPDQGWRNVVCGVLSALAGHPIGYGFEKLIQVAHHLADRFPMALVPFGHGLRAAGHGQLITDQDRHGRWERKAEKARAALRSGDLTYNLDPELLNLLRFLFPQLPLTSAANHARPE